MKAFSKLSPNSDQVKEFIKLSEFEFGEYLMAKLIPRSLPRRSYKIFTDVPGANFKRLGVIMKCESFYRNSSISSY